MGLMGKGAIGVFFVLCLPFSASADAGFQLGLRAENKGQYEKAFELWEPLAQNGNRRAQYRLGLLYETGNGVAQNFEQSLYWYSQSARQGYPKAQSNLAAMYFSGRGAKRDQISAFMWANIASLNGMENAGIIGYLLLNEMSGRQINTALARVASCLRTQYADCEGALP